MKTWTTKSDDALLPWHWTLNSGHSTPSDQTSSSELNLPHRVILWISLAGLSWLAMQAVHELGHVLGAGLTGGTVTSVDLHPAHISRTAVDPNPVPVLVIWSGPVFGALAPLPLWLLSRKLFPDAARYFQFFAGFCLIANGAYLGCAVVDPVGDAFDLLQHGVPLWQLALFGLLAVPGGIWLWDGLPAALGMKLGTAAPPANHAWVILGLFLGLAIIEVIVFR